MAPPRRPRLLASWAKQLRSKLELQGWPAMVMTVTNTTVPSRVGPGYIIDLATTLATVPSDVFSVFAYPPAGNTILRGDAPPTFPSVCALTMGIVSAGVLRLGALDQYVAPGTAILLACQVAHANGTVFDSVNSPGWTWEPTGGLYMLVWGLAQSPTNSLLYAAFKNSP